MQGGKVTSIPNKTTPSKTTSSKSEEPRIFVRLKDIKRRPRPEQTEDEIRAWVMEQLQADKKTLDLLATL